MFLSVVDETEISWVAHRDSCAHRRGTAGQSCTKVRKYIARSCKTTQLFLWWENSFRHLKHQKTNNKTWKKVQHPNDVTSCPYIFLHFLLSSPSTSFLFVVSSCFFSQGERRSFNKRHKLKVLKQLYITRAFLFCFFVFICTFIFVFNFFFSPPHRPLVQSVC